MLETAEKTLCDILFKVDARVLIDDLLPQIFRKVLITDTEHIESDTVVQKLHLAWLLGWGARGGVERDCIPGDLDPRGGHVVMLKELANGVGAIHFEPVVSAAELLQQAEIME